MRSRQKKKTRSSPRKGTSAKKKTRVPNIVGPNCKGKQVPVGESKEERGKTGKKKNGEGRGVLLKGYGDTR